MARKPRELWSEPYRRRIESAERRAGAIFEGDKARLRQLARGHKPKEHVTRRETRIALGIEPTTSDDYKFLKMIRDGVVGAETSKPWIIGKNAVTGEPVIRVETKEGRFERARRAFLARDRNERDDIKSAQRRMHRRYLRGIKSPEFYDLVDDLDDDIALMFFYRFR